MSLTFIVGAAADAHPAEFASSVDETLRTRFPAFAPRAGDPYESDAVDARGWMELQARVRSAIGRERAPQLTGVEAYQAVFLPLDVPQVERLTIPRAADPLQVGGVAAMLAELHAFAAAAALPVDELELMQLSNKYLEDDLLIDEDLDVQTYVQLMLSAKQAAVRGEALWFVV